MTDSTASEAERYREAIRRLGTSQPVFDSTEATAEIARCGGFADDGPQVLGYFESIGLIERLPPSITGVELWRYRGGL